MVLLIERNSRIGFLTLCRSLTARSLADPDKTAPFQFSQDRGVQSLHPAGAGICIRTVRTRERHVTACRKLYQRMFRGSAPEADPRASDENWLGPLNAASPGMAARALQ